MKTIIFSVCLSALFCLLQASKCEKESLAANLPETVKTYLQNNYPGYELEEAEQESYCTGQTVYEVEIETAEDNEVEIAFDAKGNFLFTETAIKPEDLPGVIKSAVSGKYSDYAIKEADKLTLASGAVQYEVEMQKGKKSLSTLFDAEAAFICESAD